MNSVLRKLVLLLTVTFFIGCGSARKSHHQNTKVKFLSEYVLPDNTVVDNTLVGGLSGIDFNKGTYYLVCDDSKNPRIYEASITIQENKISEVKINKAIVLNTIPEFLDLESIRFDSKENQILLTSEGSIRNGIDPLFFSIDSLGAKKSMFQLPSAFKANSIEKPRHNGTLEGLCMAYNQKGYWLGMELPLESDGSEPKFTPTKSPVRITYIGAKTRQPKKQFGYFLDAVAKKPNGSFSVNGLTDLVELDNNIFLVLERSYSSGLGNQGNTIKLFKVDASKATNILNMISLKNKTFVSATKTLLFDFEDFRDQLTDKSIDNIEGITLGPKLSNGHQSLILVSDNNFNTQGKQLNQFILLELVED